VGSRSRSGLGCISSGTPAASMAAAHAGTSVPLITHPDGTIIGRPARSAHRSNPARASTARATSSGSRCANRKIRDDPTDRSAIGSSARS
jgi:hypothetical protein